jgi:hypothetical protein
MCPGPFTAGFAESRSEQVVDAEYCWAVLEKVFVAVQVLAIEKPERNSFVTSFDRTGKATARLSCYWKICGYTFDVHQFLYQNTVSAKAMRAILTTKGFIEFGIERHPHVKSLIVATSGECMGKVPFAELRAWLATTVPAIAAPARPTAVLATPAPDAHVPPAPVAFAADPAALSRAVTRRVASAAAAADVVAAAVLPPPVPAAAAAVTPAPILQPPLATSDAVVFGPELPPPVSATDAGVTPGSVLQPAVATPDAVVFGPELPPPGVRTKSETVQLCCDTFSVGEQKIIFEHLLGQHKEDFLYRHAGNNFTQAWLKIVSIRGEDRSWETFRRSLSKPTLAEYCAKIGGTVERGVEYLARRLMGLDKVHTVLGVRRGGGLVTLPWTIQETAGCEDYCGLKTCQRRKLARVLRYHHGGLSVMAPELEVRKIDIEHALPYELLEATAASPLEHSEYLYDANTVLFRASKLEDSFNCLMRNYRDGVESCQPGSESGESGGVRLEGC